MINLHYISTFFLASLVTTTPTQSFASSLSNGGFQSEDFTGWTQDVDGLGSPTAGLNDFSITQSTTGDFVAKIETDYWSTPGDTSSTAQNEAIFANTLFQTLDLSSSSGQNLQLSFDWTLSGEQSNFDENFIVGLGDGTGNYFDAKGNSGFLFNPTNYGSGTFTVTLDSMYTNALSNWTLDFQLNAGFDGFGSNFTIGNVKLNPVPVPAAFWLFGSALISLTRYRKKR